MNTTVMSHINNDEIMSIMHKKFIAQFKAEANSFNYSNDLELNTLNTLNINENDYEYKIKILPFLFPSLHIGKIEQVLNDNQEMTLGEAIQRLKEMLIAENLKNKINTNTQNTINRSSFLPKKKVKRNYNSLLSQTRTRNNLPLNNNIIKNNMNTINNISNNVNNIQGVNSRINFYRNKPTEKVKDDERKKLELKIVDKIAEDLLQSKDAEDLKKYLFIQLLLLSIKKDKERSIQKMNNLFNDMDKDSQNLSHSLNINIRSLNKAKGELSRKENKIKELEEEIAKKKENINFYEIVGTNLYLSLNMNKLNIKDIDN